VRSTGDRRHAPAGSWWLLATAATVLAGLLLPLLHDTRHYFYGDTQAAYYGWWYHLGDQLRAGHWPLLDLTAWRAGNLTAEGQWGLFSPLVMSIGLLTTVTGEVLVLATAVKLTLAVAGALGVHVLARSYGAAHTAAYVAAVAVPLGGMTQFLDLPSWAAGLMIWALVPWAWWAIRRTMLKRANPLLALLLCYLLVTVGYVYGTIMLILVLLACLLDCAVVRDRASALRVLGIGAFSGLVACTVYLPGVLTAPVTIRNLELGLVGSFGGKFTTDPLALFTSVIPTASVPGTTEHLLPYAYAAWFLPALLWVDVGRLRRASKPLAGLFLMTSAILLVVVGPAQLGPLRWPLRLQPFLVQTLVLLCVVLVGRYVVRRPSPRRLVASLAWVVLAGVVAVVRAPGLWSGHLVSVLVGCAGLALAWRLFGSRHRRPRMLAGLVATFTLGLFVLQQVYFPSPPSPERNLPAQLAGYRTQLDTAEGESMVVGDVFAQLQADPGAARDFLAGSAWYLNPHPVQNTYTTISFKAFYDRYCVRYSGFTCPDLLDTLFSTEPVTGRLRVDLLGVSTLLLVRDDFPAGTASAPPEGWHVADTTPRAVTWVRDDPVPGAGGPVWSSAGTSVSVVSSGDRTLRLAVDRTGRSGGRVVLSRLAWPGYDTDVGRLADPVDGYLVTLRLPAESQGSVVTVRFSPPGWTFGLTCWWAATMLGLLWVLLEARRRRSPASRPDGQVAERVTVSASAAPGPTVRSS
jgi:hypothetical protein